VLRRRERRPALDEAHFGRHDEQVMESLRNRVEKEYGERYKSLAEAQRKGAFQKLVDDHLGDQWMEKVVVDLRNRPMTFFPITHPSQLKAKYFFRENEKFPVTLVLAKDRARGNPLGVRPH
jgi:hypothetical protein